jgi:hypothetical protein
VFKSFSSPGLAIFFNTILPFALVTLSWKYISEI